MNKIPKLICQNKKCRHTRQGNMQDALEYLMDSTHIVKCSKCRTMMSVETKQRDRWLKKADKVKKTGKLPTE